jgi:hypothetical protein
VFLKVPLHEGKAADDPREPSDEKRGDLTVAIKVNQSGEIYRVSRDANGNQIPLFHLNQSKGKFENPTRYEPEHVFEMIPLGAAVIVHSRAHVIRGHIIFGMMHTNVVRIIQAERNTKHVTQKARPDVIEMAKLSIENGAVRCVVNR